jgi:alpha-glucosidase
MPKVIVTNRDKSLMNAVETVFPNSTAMVCRYHVYKNVRAKFKALCRAKDQKMEELLNTLKYQWEAVVDSTSEEAFTDAVMEFRRVFARFPKFLKYF